jgi:2-oxoisovalerate dehydrogenase E1 component beta subunit
VREGDDVTVITYGSMVHVAVQAADSVPDVGVRILDLRTLKPLDTDAVLEAARATGKVIVLHAANRNTGVGAEVAALIAEEAFESLDGPIVRLGGADTRFRSARRWRTPTARRSPASPTPSKHSPPTDLDLGLPPPGV